MCDMSKSSLKKSGPPTGVLEFTTWLWTAAKLRCHLLTAGGVIVYLAWIAPRRARMPGSCGTLRFRRSNHSRAPCGSPIMSCTAAICTHLPNFSNHLPNFTDHFAIACELLHQIVCQATSWWTTSFELELCSRNFLLADCGACDEIQHSAGTVWNLDRQAVTLPSRHSSNTGNGPQPVGRLCRTDAGLLLLFEHSEQPISSTESVASLCNIRCCMHLPRLCCVSCLLCTFLTSK